MVSIEGELSEETREEGIEQDADYRMLSDSLAVDYYGNANYCKHYPYTWREYY